MYMSATSRISRLLFIAFALTLVPHLARAAEPICPGGSSPRSDISWCADFESYNNVACSVGSELACATANSLSSISGTFAIKGGDAAVGNGSIVGSGVAGGTGPGYSNASLPAPVTSASFRYYVKFKDGYLASSWSRGNHGPSLEGSGTGCYVRVSLDWSTTTNYVVQGSCAPDGGYNLPNNISTVHFQNNRWYLIESQVIMNTTTNGTGPFNGNGVVRAWIDGTKVLEYTNLNIRGSSNATFQGVFAARSYYGVGVPAWSQKILYDNFAVSNNGTYIGAAANENPRGTADTSSPYINLSSYNGMMGRKMGADCTSTGGESGYTPIIEKWRTGTNTLQTSIAHAGYTDHCGTGPDQSLKVTVNPNDGGGLGHPVEILANTPRQVVHGWVYLPSSNDYSSNTPLAGFARYGANTGGANNWGNQLGFGVSNGKWAIIQRSNSADVVTATAVPATLNAWHEFEIVVSKSNTYSLMIDRTWLFDDAPAAQNVGTWAWDTVSGGPRYAVVGILDHRGSTQFTAYFDDADVGSASYWSCKGWGAESCPFTTSPPPPPPPPPSPPSPPTGVAATLM